MSDFKHLFRISRTIWIGGLLMALALTGAFAQQPVPPTISATCDYNTAPATVSLTAANVPAGYNTTYLLVDLVTGAIVQANASEPVFANVSQGLYYAVAAHYKGLLIDATAGKLISNVYESSACLTYSTTLLVRVCAAATVCDFVSAPANVSFTATNIPAGVTTTYALVDEATNLIVQISGSVNFSNVPKGDYAITAVHYTGTLSGLQTGNRLYDITTSQANCMGVSNTVRIRVCSFPVTITGPTDGTTIASLNPPITGIATPGSNVTVTTPDGQTCITTASSPDGSWTCTSLTFAAGPQSVTATDGTTTAVSNFTVAPTNQPPSVTPDFNNVVAGVPATGNVLTNDKDPEGTPLTASVVGTPPVGLTLSPDGSYTYTAPIGTTAPVTVPIQVCDSGTPLSCATTTLTLVPVPANTPANDAPIANPDAPKTTTGVPVIVAVLANDVDPEGQPLSNPTIVTQPTHGTALVNPDGTVSYTPTAGYTGTDVLTYSVCDGGTPPKCATALVTFTIDPTPPAGVTNTAPVALDDALLTSVGTSATGTVAANDSDPQGQPLVFAKLSGPANGTVVFSPTGSYTYVPAPGFVGSEQFTYQVCDNASPVLCATATAHLTVIASPPSLTVTGPVNVTTTTTPTIAGTATPGSTIAITDPSGVTVCTTTASASGTFACALTSPLPEGPTALTVTASNPGGSVSEPITFTTVAPASLTVAPTGPQTTTAPVISGTTTPGATVVITGPGPATLCTTTASISGIFSCTVATPVGPNTLTVTACTTAGCSSTTTSFTAVGPPTVAILSPADNSTATTTPTVSGTATPLASVTVSGGGNTPVVLTADGSGNWSTTALSFPTGPNTVTATVSNLAGTATDVNVFTVVAPAANQAPLVTPDFIDVVAGVPATGNVLTNDKDPEGTPLTAAVVGTPPVGFTMSPDGSYTYTAPIGTTAPVTVPIQVCDGATPPSCATTTLTLIPVPANTPANDAPIANPDAPKTTTGVPVIVAVLANDVDPEGQPLSNPTIVSQPTHGTAVVNPDGTVSYTPTAGYTGTDMLTYSVCDGGTPPACSTALVTFTIDPTPPVGVTNTAPVAIDDALLTSVGTSATSTVAANDSDPQGQPLTFTKLSGPTTGTVVFSPTGSYTYVPAPGFVGAEQFTYQVCDNASPALCATATAYLTVQPAANQAPSVTPDFIDVVAGVPATGNVLTNDKDPEGTPLTASVVGTPPVGLTLSPDGSYTYTAPIGTTAPVTVPIQVCDGATPPSCATTTLTLIPVPANTPANDAPIANPDAPKTTTGVPVIVAVLANDVDPEGQPLSNPTIVSQPTHGTAVVNPDGTVSYTPTAGYTGTDMLTYSVCDGGTPPACSTALVTFTIDPTPPVGVTNTAPVALDDALLTSVGTSATGTVAANDSDPQGQPLVFAKLSGPANGTVVFSPTGSYTYVPAPGFVGSEQFTYQVCDNASPVLCATATVHMTIQPAANQAPSVTPDFIDVVAGVPATGNVLTNDKDPEGTPLTASVVGTPPVGLTLSPDGSYTYTAPIGTTAPVTVPIQVCDGATPPSCATTTLTLIPVPANTPGNDAPIANPDAPKTTTGVPVIVAVLANDVDPEGQPLSNPVIVTQPTHGTAVVNPDGTVSYTPTAGYTGTDMLTYSVCDGGTPPACSTALVTFTIDPTPPTGVTNTAPVALDDALLTSVGTSATGTVAANDSDPQGQPLVFAKLSGPANGTVVFSPTGSYTYVPAPGFVGSEQFTYQVCDNASPALCATATAYLTVQPAANQAPSVTPDFIDVVAGVPATGNVLTNDKDPEGTPLTASVVGTPPVGLTLSPDGSYTYTAPIGTTAPVTVPIQVCDGATPPSCATTTLTLIPVPANTPGNDAPIANPDAPKTTTGVPVIVAVLANDVDPEGQPLSNPVIVTQPTHGTAVVNPDGTVSYTPTAGYTGTDMLTYSVCDGGTPPACSTALVTFTIDPTPPTGVTNTAPVALDDALLTSVGTSATGTVAANDSDPQGQPLVFAKLSGPANGTVVFSPTGSYTYVPAPGFVGSEQFTYQVCDNASPVLCATATVHMTIQPAANQAPSVTPDFIDVVAGVPATGNVLTNDKDPEGTPLTASVVGTPPVGLTLSPDGSYTYTAPIGTTAPVTVPIQVCDGATPPSCATTTLTLIPVPANTPGNDAPIANPDAPKTTTGVPVIVAVLANDVDPEGQPLSNPVIVTQPTHGTAVVNPDGTVSYTPTAGYTGTDMLTYSVCDGGTPPACSTALVTFTIDPTPPAGVTNTAPVALDDALLTSVGTSATGTVAANDSDPQGQPLVFAKLSGPANGTVVFSPTGSYTYVPAPGFVGSEQFTYQVCDNASPALCATATAYLTVQPAANQAPSVTPDFIDVVAGVPATGNVLTNDKDPEGTPLTASVVGTPPVGLTLSPDGSYTYTAPIGTTAPVTVPIQVCDGATPPSCATTTLTLVPVPANTPANDAPIANPDAPKTTAGIPVIVAVLANDVDPEGQPLSNPTIVTQPTHGTAVVNPDGTVSYTPTAGYTGTDVLTYSVCDGGTPPKCATALVTFTIDPTPPVGVTNTAPVALDDALLTSVGTSATGTVAANDSDPQGQPLVFAKLSGPTTGTVVFSPTGSYTYVPAPGFVGAEQFTYQVCDNASPTLCTTATVHLTVAPAANQAPLVTPDFIDVVAGVPATGNVLTNDKDPEGTPLTATTVGTPPMGFTMSPDGSYTYTAPFGTTAPVTVPIQVCDSATPPSCATTTLTLVPVPANTPANEAPIANPDAPKTTTGVPVIVAVLANDVDPEGQPLSNPAIVTQPTHGTAVVNPDGTVSYTPTAGYTGTDMLTYSVCDGGTPPRCSTALVTFTIDPTPPAGVTNTAPVALDDALLTSVGTSATGTVAANDSDPQGQPLVFAKLSGPASGTVVFSPTGSYTYVPAPGFVGSEQFTYQVCDNASPVLCATATAHLTVIASPPSLTVTGPVNVTTTTTPTIAGTATPGSTIAITDPSGVTVCTTTASASGTFACALTSPLPEGPTALTVTASNPGGSVSEPITFTTVAPASLTVAPTGPQTTTAPVISGTTTPGATVVITGPGPATLCTTTASISGIFSCTVATPVGPNTLTVTACTTAGCSSTTTSFTAVGPPTVAILSPADNGTATTTPTVSGTATPLASVTVSGGGNTPVVLTADGSGNWSTTALSFPTGPNTVTATVSNLAGTATDVNVFTVVAPAANQAPLVTPDFIDVVAGVPATGNVLTNDKDPEGTPLTASVVGTPPVGFTLSPDGSYTYTAPIGTTAPVTVPIQVCDSATPPSCATTTLTLVPVPASTPANDAPIANPDAPKTTTGVPVIVAVLANDVDPEGQPLSNPTIVTQPTHGTAVVNPDGTVSYTPTAGYTGTDMLTYSVCDGGTPPRCSTALVTFTIDPTPPTGVTNTAPVALDDALLTSVGTSATGTVAANDSDPQGQPLVFTKLSGPTTGTVVFSPTGSYTYTPAPGFVGAEQFTYQVCDNASPTLCTTATAHLTVQTLPATPPTVTILSPATNGTATTSPLVSGTATPTSIVTLTDPNGATLCSTTATAGGLWSCAVTVPPGSNTITATACTSAGCSTAVTSFTAVSPAGTLPPVATPDIANTNPGTPVSGNVLTNDADPQGLPLTASLLTPPVVGTATIAPNGSYTYTPPAGFTGTVSFCYSVSNTAGVSSSACVTVNVNPLPSPLTNDAPIANNDNTKTTAGTSVTINVAANDTDSDSATTLAGQLSAPVIVSQPSVGTAIVNPDGTIKYTPPVGFTGVVSFPYSICDQATSALCATAVVSVNVQPTPPVGTTLAPVAIDDALLTTKDVPKPGTVAANDTDPAGLPLTYTSGQPTSGTVVMSPNGSYTYTPATGYVGPTSFTYAVCNSAGKCAVATVSVDVQVPQMVSPLIVAVPIVTSQGKSVTVCMPIIDAGQPASHTALICGQPDSGTASVSVNVAGQVCVTYTPTATFTGATTVCVQVCDSQGNCTQTIVPITVIPTSTTTATPQPPIVVVVPVITLKNTPVQVCMDIVDPNAGDVQSVSVCSNPAMGSVTAVVNNTTHQVCITFQPTSGSVGQDAICLNVCDQSGLCSTVIIPVTIISPTPPGLTPTAPLVTPTPIVTTTDKPIIVCTGIADNVGDIQTATLCGPPASGTALIGVDNVTHTLCVTYTPGSTPTNTYVCVQVCDQGGLCSNVILPITVLPAPSTGVVLRLKVMLQGALIGGTGGLMRDDLRSKKFLPLTEPYSAIGGLRFTHVNGGGGETMPAAVTALNAGTGDAVVDWVFVELRDPSNLSLVVATRSAMVQRDGDVVMASDGVSPLSFTGLTGSNFYVSVKHRNHLGAMTATAIPLSTTGTIVDFTSSTSAQLWNKTIGVFDYEGWEQTTVSGKQALWAGDANHNGKVKYQGSANDLITVFSEVIGAQGGSTNPLYNYDAALGYYFGDVNMDGKVKYQGTSNDTSLIFTNVITNFRTATQMNSAQLYNFDFMLEQIP